uniref:scavenger receptor cysteine-rich type 1 protein M130-like n=1 Tax=Epinephelus lanceolatus TaxID=310571 RepID=UPI00144587CD|nr:scavenger receptor cysteine-rich type 1 protein M130-like [Epinephelus lanceolatus]
MDNVYSVRLVDGTSLCSGRLEVKSNQRWSSVCEADFDQQDAEVVCRELGCGAPSVLQGALYGEVEAPMWTKEFQCGGHDVWCLLSLSILSSIISPDSVRLVDGTSLCSGRLEVKSNQRWSSVCEADFDQQDAEVVCRELGCGAPSVLQGALYGEVEAPMWTKEFQCGGHESALLDCRSSGSDRNTCSPGKAVGLTCSEPVRLVGGDSRCAGTLEVKREGEWRPVTGYYSDWTLKTAGVVCRDLDCGSAVSVGEREESYRPVWWIRSECVHSGSALRECATSDFSSTILDLTCSDSVRLVDGTSLCSGRLEVKSNQRWSSVCEADFDQQDAEVVCRELGCGAPSVLQGALYGEVEAPMWTKEFQCGGHESALLDCRSSGSDRNTCSPGKAVGLKCSEPVRLVGGHSRCAGTLEVKHGEWRPVNGYDLTLKEAAIACRDLDCGSAVSVGQKEDSIRRPVWWIRSDCIESGSALRECVKSDFSFYTWNFPCSETCCFSQWVHTITTRVCACGAPDECSLHTIRQLS